jgi:nucleoside-diphosphate-sugar epimerase
MKRILIIGCGDVGERLVRRYAGQAQFSALTRSASGVARLHALGVAAVVGDLDHPESLARLPRADGVFHFAPPPNQGEHDSRTRHLLQALTRRGVPRRVVYISTSGVYGDCAGSWVEETRPTACRSSASAAARRR